MKTERDGIIEERGGRRKGSDRPCCGKFWLVAASLAGTVLLWVMLGRGAELGNPLRLPRALVTMIRAAQLDFRGRVDLGETYLANARVAQQIRARLQSQVLTSRRFVPFPRRPLTACYLGIPESDLSIAIRAVNAGHLFHGSPGWVAFLGERLIPLQPVARCYPEGPQARQLLLAWHHAGASSSVASPSPAAAPEAGHLSQYVQQLQNP